MDDILRAIMDAQTALQRAQVLLEGQAEKADDGPVYVKNGMTDQFFCECGGYLDYGDNYCPMCGKKQRWGAMYAVDRQ